MLFPPEECTDVIGELYLIGEKLHNNAALVVAGVCLNYTRADNEARKMLVIAEEEASIEEAISAIAAMTMEFVTGQACEW